METYNPYVQAKLIKRNGGRSASGSRSVVASAAYRSGENLLDYRLEMSFDYRPKSKGIVATRIIAPKDAPEWVFNRELLWNRVEQSEKRKDSQLARELTIQFPHEIAQSKRADMIWDFATRNFAMKGMIADIAIHRPGKGDDRNEHGHILLTMRELAEDGFGLKNRDWNANEVLESWREDWERLCNLALDEAQSNIRFDRRSIADQRAEKLEQADGAFDWIERRRFEIEAARLDYLPRPHLPQTLFRLMVAGGPIPADDQPAVANWEAARISKAAAYARAAEMEIELENDILAENQLQSADQVAQPASPAPEDEHQANDAQSDTVLETINVVDEQPQPKTQPAPIEADQADKDTHTHQVEHERAAQQLEDDRIAFEEVEALRLKAKKEKEARRRTAQLIEFEDRWMLAVEDLPTPALPSKTGEPFFKPHGSYERFAQGALNPDADLFSAKGMKEVGRWEQLKLKAHEIKQIMRKALLRWVDRIISDLSFVTTKVKSFWRALVGDNQIAIGSLQNGVASDLDLFISLRTAVSEAQIYHPDPANGYILGQVFSKQVGPVEQAIKVNDHDEDTPDVAPGAVHGANGNKSSESAFEALDAENAVSVAREAQFAGERTGAKAKMDRTDQAQNTPLAPTSNPQEPLSIDATAQSLGEAKKDAPNAREPHEALDTLEAAKLAHDRAVRASAYRQEHAEWLLGPVMGDDRNPDAALLIGISVFAHDAEYDFKKLLKSYMPTLENASDPREVLNCLNANYAQAATLVNAVWKNEELDVHYGRLVKTIQYAAAQLRETPWKRIEPTIEDLAGQRAANAIRSAINFLVNPTNYQKDAAVEKPSEVLKATETNQSDTPTPLKRKGPSGDYSR